MSIQCAVSIYWENYTFNDQLYPKDAKPNGWHIENGMLLIGDLPVKSIFSFNLSNEADLYFDWKSDFIENNTNSWFTFTGSGNIREDCANNSGFEKKHYHLNPGEVKWRVISGTGRHGYIDNLFIRYNSDPKIPIKFFGESYSPQEGFSSSDPLFPVDRKKFKFNISLETNLAACEVDLFTIPPGTGKDNSIFQGTKIFNGNQLTWDDVAINCTSCGQSYYYFVATYQGNSNESNIFKGPTLFACILDYNYSNSEHTDDKYIYRYSIKISSNRNVNVVLSFLNISGNWNPYGGIRKHNASNSEEWLYWNFAWNKSEVYEMFEDKANGGCKFGIERI